MLTLAVSFSLVYDLTNKIDGYIAKGKPLFVKYAAPWCTVCLTMNENFDAVSDMVPGLKSGYVNCISRESFCLSQGVVKFPTLILYNAPGEKEPILYEGRMKAPDMQRWLINHLSKPEA